MISYHIILLLQPVLLPAAIHKKAQIAPLSPSPFGRGLGVRVFKKRKSNRVRPQYIYDPLLAQLKPDKITIIGGSHKKTESVALFKSLALAAIKQYRCIVIGLEIASGKQTILDAVVQGGAFNELALWPALDHPPYLSMIESFAGLKRQGQCIKLIATDSGVANNIDRDLWIALSLTDQAVDAPVLVLLHHIN